MTQPDFARRFPAVPRGRPFKYGVTQWTDGNTYVLRRGVDFHAASTDRFYKSVWQWAKNNGYRLTFRTLSNQRCELQMRQVG